MTPREREIMNFLRENPQISQKEIAKRLNITRSGAATHINHLVSAGYILGRGYILREEEYIIVIGGANMDIVGITDSPLIPKDSNPGKIYYSSGGVGRNITENLARLDINVTFLFALGQDDSGRRIEKELRDLGVDTSNVIFGEGITPHYVAIMDEDHDMALAISDMDVVERVDENYLRSHKKIIEASQYAVLDTNLSQNALDFLFENIKGNYLVDGVSTAKVVKLKKHLKNINFLKVNIYEAQVLCDMESEDVRLLGRELICRGLYSLVITLGAKGAYYFDSSREYFLPARPISVATASGAGDAFMAGYVYGIYHGMKLEERMKFAMAASRIALKSSSTSSEDFQLKNIKGELKNVDER